jgi:hypothetical protein
LKIMEFDSTQGIPKGMYDASADKLSSADIMDTRKNKLTLKDLNKLKKLRAFRRLEDLKRQDTLGIIYGEPAGDDEGGGDMDF